MSKKRAKKQGVTIPCHASVVSPERFRAAVFQRRLPRRRAAGPPSRRFPDFVPIRSFCLREYGDAPSAPRPGRGLSWIVHPHMKLSRFLTSKIPAGSPTVKEKSLNFLAAYPKNLSGAPRTGRGVSPLRKEPGGGGETPDAPFPEISCPQYMKIMGRPSCREKKSLL